MGGLKTLSEKFSLANTYNPLGKSEWKFGDPAQLGGCCLGPCPICLSKCVSDGHDGWICVNGECENNKWIYSDWPEWWVWPVRVSKNEYGAFVVRLQKELETPVAPLTIGFTLNMAIEMFKPIFSHPQFILYVQLLGKN